MGTFQTVYLPKRTFSKIDWHLFTALAGVAVIDIVLTYHALFNLSPGHFYERNQIAASLLNAHGPIALLVPYPLGITACAALSLIHPWRQNAFRALLAFYLVFATYTVSSNIRLVLMYYL